MRHKAELTPVGQRNGAKDAILASFDTRRSEMEKWKCNNEQHRNSRKQQSLSHRLLGKQTIPRKSNSRRLANLTLC